MGNNPEVLMSVLTPTYNRADTLARCYYCLEAQTYRKFEWIVVDDGSTDGTEDLIRGFKEIASFPIHYIKKKNGGKHTAVNTGYQHLRGQYLFILDSDDVFVSDCFEKALKLWDEIPVNKLGEYCTVCGRCIRHDNHQFVGTPFPENINTLNHKKQYRIAYHTLGEKCSCMRTSVAIEYPFPEPQDVTFVGESVIWNQMNRKYKQWYTNEVFRIYTFDSASGLSRNLFSNRMLKGRYFTFCYDLNHSFSSSIFPIEQYFKTLLGITYIGGFLGKSPTKCIYDVDHIHNKILVIMLSIVSISLRASKKFFDKK